MNDNDLTDVRARIPDYPGLADPMARRLGDQQLRAWAGELLTGVRDRADLSDAMRERLEDAILRCEFGDQRLMMAFEEHAALDDPAAQAALAAADRTLIEAIDAALAAPGSETLEAVHHALDARIRTATGDAE